MLITTYKHYTNNNTEMLANIFKVQTAFSCVLQIEAGWVGKPVLGISIRFLMIMLTNSGPWALMRISIHSSRHITEYKKLATVFALLSGVAVASVHLEKWSVTATIYLFPLLVS